MSAPIRDSAWSTAVPDWVDRIMSGRSLVPDLPLNTALADRSVGIFRRLKVPDMEGNPTYGEVCGPWVFDLVRAIFGSYDPITRRRALREFFLLVPKKNGKSSIAAAIIVTAAILNERPEAELLLIAPTKEIAGIAFKQAGGIIKLDTELSKLFHPQEHLKKLTHRITGAAILIKASDADVITGSKATYILIDETHVFATKTKAMDIFVEIRGSLAARPDGFLMQITTQSKTPPSGVFKAELATARDVRDGVIALPMLAVLYELPLDMAVEGGWKNESTWALVNPNLGRSVDAAYLRDEMLKAEREGPEKMALIASQHFNVEVGLALHANRWAGALYWQSAVADGITLRRIMDTCDVCAVGLDGGGLDDLFGLYVIGREKETRTWIGWGHAWAHAIVLERRKDIAPLLRDFEQAGDLTICSHPTQDLVEAAEIVAMLNDAGLLPQAAAIGLDPAGVAALVDEMSTAGIAAPQMVAISQGYRLSPAIWGMERKLMDGTFRHGGQGLMAWAVGNARAEQKGNAVMITKEVAGKAKIDPLIAAFNAFTLMSRNPSAGTPVSPWENPDFRLAS